MNNKIEKGDIVRVDFNGAQLTLVFEAEVIYVPCAVGDLWIFRDIHEDMLFYVSERCTVTLIKKGEGWLSDSDLRRKIVEALDEDHSIHPDITSTYSYRKGYDKAVEIVKKCIKTT